VPVTLVAGTKYPITIEYFEGSQGATARLLWQTPWAPTTFTPIPTDRLYTTIPPSPGVGGGSGLSGSYFGNVGLSGAALVTRTEGVNFSWGTVAPAVGVPADGYSVRWSGTVEAPLSGTYRLQTISDDGVRVTFNGARVIDNWTYHGPATDTAAPVTLVAGTKYPITIEYFEGSQGATARLLWQTPWAPTDFAPIPTDRLYTP
jgi:hypothetical protein